MMKAMRIRRKSRTLELGELGGLTKGCLPGASIFSCTILGKVLFRTDVCPGGGNHLLKLEVFRCLC